MKNKNMTTKNPIWDANDSVLVLIDYQPEVLDLIHGKNPKLIELNAIALTKAAVKFNIPIVLSTVGVNMGVNKPTISSLREIIPDVPEIDRTSMNAWEDEAFVEAIKKTGRKKIVMNGIVTSTCLAFAGLEALAEGFEVMVVEDAVGDQTLEAHQYAITRLIEAGAVPNNTSSTIAEWFRDWADPRANVAREIYPKYLADMYELRGFKSPWKDQASH